MLPRILAFIIALARFLAPWCNTSKLQRVGTALVLLAGIGTALLQVLPASTPDLGASTIEQLMETPVCFECDTQEGLSDVADVVDGVNGGGAVEEQREIVEDLTGGAFQLQP